MSFLTILPIAPGSGNGGGGGWMLEDAARHMHLFPAVGIAIGLLVGSIGLGLSEFMSPMLVGLLSVSSLAIITGIHHADGLADFADGLMTGGSRGKRLKSMKDPHTGSAGVVATILCLAGSIIAISSLAGGFDVLRAILISEILAKFSMVLMASLGRPATAGSSSIPFIKMMRGDRRRPAAAFVIMIIPVVLMGGATGLAMLGAAAALTLIVLATSIRSFGGVTGDAMGATNELARLASLVAFVAA